MTHSFDIDIARRFGILEAILLHYFEFWIQKNKANDTNFYDGHYWTYNSISAFVELFPYATKSKICTALNHLEKEGLIATNNYNKSSYDRTKWYRLTDAGIAVLNAQPVEISDFLNLDNRESENRKWNDKKSEMDCQEIGNGLSENRKPIPFNNHIENTVNKNTVDNTVIHDEFERLWGLYPNKKGKKNAEQKYLVARKEGVTYEEVERGIEAYKRYLRARGTSPKYIKHGSTFFSERAWQDDWSVNERTDGFDRSDYGSDGNNEEPYGWENIFG